jgi:hypothetical protein
MVIGVPNNSYGPIIVYPSLERLHAFGRPLARLMILAWQSLTEISSSCIKGTETDQMGGFYAFTALLTFCPLDAAPLQNNV